MSKQFYTYLYLDPKDNTPIYVGKGKGRRAFRHLRESQNPHLHNTLQKRKGEGYITTPIINYEVDEQTSHQMEMFWIDQFGRADLGTGTLFNLTDGGEGVSGRACSDEVKLKLSLLKKGKPRSPETRAKISAANKAKVFTTEQRENIAARNKARGPISDETRAKISAASSGRKGPKGMLGKKHSNETRAKISAAHKGKPKKRK